MEEGVRPQGRGNLHNQIFVRFVTRLIVQADKRPQLVFFSCLYYAIMFDGKGEMRMSPALMKMWISFVAMGFMVISVFTVYFTRFKVKNNVIRGILNTIAFLLIIIAGLIIFYVVFSGPVPESA